MRASDAERDKALCGIDVMHEPVYGAVVPLLLFIEIRLSSASESRGTYCLYDGISVHCSLARLNGSHNGPISTTSSDLSEQSARVLNPSPTNGTVCLYREVSRSVI